MRVLVTGGAGYIGSHTAKQLARRGHEPISVDNLSEGHRWAVQWGPLIEADLADLDGIRSALREHQIEAVIHFAASAYVGESVQHPRKYFRNNIINTLHLLEAMHDCGVRDIVFSSSCAVYGLPEHLPMSEDHPRQPINPYGESKLAVERILRWFGESYAMRWVALRYFNAAGADPEGEIGEEHEPETHIIPLVIQAALGARSHVEVFGSDYPTPDGTPIRDYVHVMDLARAHVLALEHLAAGGECAALNLGTGIGHSVLEVVRMVEQVSGSPVAVKLMSRRPGDPQALVADASRAATVLGWRPECSDLTEIVRTAWEWHRGQARGVQPVSAAPQISGPLRSG